MIPVVPGDPRDTRDGDIPVLPGESKDVRVVDIPGVPRDTRDHRDPRDVDVTGDHSPQGPQGC